MRNVLKNAHEVAHRWAHASSEGYATNPGRTASFEGDTFISYTTPVARLIQFEGRTIAIFSEDTHSVTTARHMSNARGAVSHLQRFTVPVKIRRRETVKAMCKRCVVEWKRRLEMHSTNYQGATHWATKRRHYRLLGDDIAWANQFCEFFKLPLFDLVNDDQIEEQTKRLATRRLRRAQRKTRARRKADAERLAERERRDREELCDAQAQLDAWLVGGLTRGYRWARLVAQYGCSEGVRGDRMRLSPDRCIVQTTQSASAPVEDVKKWAPMLLQLLAEGSTWEPNGVRIKFGGFNVDRLDVSGALHVGCHRFEKAELLRFAAVLGFNADGSSVEVK